MSLQDRLMGCMKSQLVPTVQQLIRNLIKPVKCNFRTQGGGVKLNCTWVFRYIKEQRTYVRIRIDDIRERLIDTEEFVRLLQGIARCQIVDHIVSKPSVNN
ncbi:hypothetical protein D3C80_1410860 [compost metagenome]